MARPMIVLLAASASSGPRGADHARSAAIVRITRGGGASANLTGSEAVAPRSSACLRAADAAHPRDPLRAARSSGTTPRRRSSSPTAARPGRRRPLRLRLRLAARARHRGRAPAPRGRRRLARVGRAALGHRRRRGRGRALSCSTGASARRGAASEGALPLQPHERASALEARTRGSAA